MFTHGKHCISLDYLTVGPVKDSIPSVLKKKKTQLEYVPFAVMSLLFISRAHLIPLLFFTGLTQGQANANATAAVEL